MRLDRREFLGVLCGALGAIAARPAASGEAMSAAEAHRATAGTGVRPVLALVTDTPEPFKRYPDLPHVKLAPLRRASAMPFAEAVRRSQPAGAFPPEEAIPLDELARLLQLTNGVTARTASGEARRAAPSAGALYAGEVYVVSERVEGLAPGLYYYAALDHELVELRRGPLRRDAALALDDPGAARGAAALVLLTNVFERYTWRYGDRGRRYALVDTGHQGENLRLAAFAGGLGERSARPVQGDALHSLLGVDGRGEAVCAVHALGGLAERPTPLLPPSAASCEARSLDECIHVRRSTREFEDRPISLADLRFVLEMAEGHAARARGAGLDLALVVHRVEELEPGVYAVDPASRGLEQRRGGDRRGALERACWGQGKAAQAAAAFVMVARLGHDAGRAGEDVYRDLLLEAGAVAQRIYLAAEACGLTARNLSAYRDGRLDALLGLDGEERAAVHLTLLGHGD